MLRILGKVLVMLDRHNARTDAREAARARAVREAWMQTALDMIGKG